MRVVDAIDPTNMVDVGSVAMRPTREDGPEHGRGAVREYIIAAGANLGVGVFRFPGLAN